MTARLQKEFFNKTCDILAKELLGKVLCRKCGDQVLKGRIVETEMYPGVTDKASHSFDNKKTKRNGAMFMAPGTAYVYFIYGMYFCFNISSAGKKCSIFFFLSDYLNESSHQISKTSSLKLS